MALSVSLWSVDGGPPDDAINIHSSSDAVTGRTGVRGTVLDQTLGHVLQR